MNLEPGWCSWYSDCTVQASNPIRDKGLFSSPTHPDQLWGPTSLIFSGFQPSFLGIKWVGPDDDHSPPSSIEVKNEWSYTSTPLVYLLGMDRDFTFFFFYEFDPSVFIFSYSIRRKSLRFPNLLLKSSTCYSSDTHRQPPQGCIKVGDHFAWMTKFFIMVPNICGSWVWNLLNVTLLVIGMFR